MLFSSLQLKAKYDSDEDDILNSFYLPILANAYRYDLAVGYFSSEVLVSAAEGLEKFIASNGKMRLVIGDPLTDREYDAVMQGLTNPAQARSAELGDLLLESLDSKLRLLTYLVANNQLEIKFAFTHKGMFHKKVGIFYQDREIVVFSGSANETLAGLSRYNNEEISVFFNWRESFKDYGQVEVDDFNSLWNNNKKRAKVVSLDSLVYQKIQAGVDIKALREELLNKSDNVSEVLPAPFFAYSFPKSTQQVEEPTIDTKLPRTPLMIRGNTFELFSHQISAISSWHKANCNGLFKLATGSGKTFTSIAALVDLYESRHKHQLSTFVVISVPYVELANQWVKELAVFNISPVKCYESSAQWSNSLDTKILRLKNGVLSFVCVVVVNKTLASDAFQSKICKVPLDDMLFIGDECHHLGSQGYFSSLPQCKYRIGRSATPFRSDEDEVEGSPFPNTVKENLLTYFKGIVSEYSLIDAINDGVLSPYRYDLVPVYLDDIEQELYEEYSLKIQRMILTAQGGLLSAKERAILTNLCGKRSRLLATCKGKLPALINYIDEAAELSLAHSLIYVGEGKASDDDSPYITKVTNRLHEHGCRVAKFTSQESNNERERIMDNFKNEVIDSLVAMKVLDEGIDVPACQTAFILASTRNPRQYVQRRGRVLRRAEGKNAALIVDFVVLPAPNSKSAASQNLRRAELDRVNDFKLTSLNLSEIDQKISELGIMQ
ncbi:helicase-related protein [Vibrio cyclitrophicus]